jgi:hypothetical protein
MTIEKFIETNRQLIINHIKKIIPAHELKTQLDNEGLRLWVLNDAALYELAKQKGVKFD